MESIIQNQVMEVAQRVEQQLDAELDRLDNMDADDLETLREKRLKEMKKNQNQRQTWLAMVILSISNTLSNSYDSSYSLNPLLLILLPAGTRRIFRNSRRERLFRSLQEVQGHCVSLLQRRFSALQNRRRTSQDIG